MFLSSIELFLTPLDIYFVCISTTLHGKDIVHAVFPPDSHLRVPFPQFWSSLFKKEKAEQEEAQKRMAGAMEQHRLRD